MNSWQSRAILGPTELMEIRHLLPGRFVRSVLPNREAVVLYKLNSARDGH